MTSLPRGTVTLLFSDIEGSTELQHRLGDHYQEVAETHRRLLEAAFAAHGGQSSIGRPSRSSASSPAPSTL